MIGDVISTPPADWRDTTELGRFMNWLRDHGRGRLRAPSRALHRFSVTDLEGFWGGLWEFYGIRAAVALRPRAGPTAPCPGAKWFPGAQLNYAEHLVGTDEDRDRVAVVARSQTRPPRELTFGELRDLAGSGPGGTAASRRPAGRPRGRLHAQHPGDARGVHRHREPGRGLGHLRARVRRAKRDGRFGQVEPKILITIGGYGFRDRYVDRRPEVAAIRAAVADARARDAVPYGEAGVPDTIAWDDLTSQSKPLEFDQVPADHPLYVLFSSGTTGLPKPIVHGHGRQLIEHHKNQGVSWDLKPGGRLLWFSTTAWMMWNALVSALLLRSSIVMLDGDPALARSARAVAAGRASCSRP